MKFKKNSSPLNIKPILKIIVIILTGLLLITAYQDRDKGELFVFVFSMLIHECFHIMSGAFLGYEIAKPSPALFGLKFSLDFKPPTGIRGAFLYLSGPFGNLIFALTISLLSLKFYIYKSDFFIFYNLLIAGINLVPAYPLDASRALASILSIRLGEFKAVKIVSFISELIALVLFIIGIYIFIFASDNMLLVLLSLMIMNATRKEKAAVTSDYLSKISKRYI